ncbi:hypothetical protein [Kordia sp.]|uniref:hypothetical protein n=1 Tax=Kordia sp. TaxID=1965332 RepID=UPI0025C60201|nr:hypothetical protein [Kordia sp.]MCH2192855.1 hypothetical protein [Kordia sp.]
MQKFVASIITVFCVLFNLSAQETGIDGTWNFSSILNAQSESVVPIIDADKLTFQTG